MVRYVAYGILVFVFMAVLYVVFSGAESESADSEEVDDMGYLGQLKEFAEDK